MNLGRNIKFVPARVNQALVVRLTLNNPESYGVITSIVLNILVSKLVCYIVKVFTFRIHIEEPIFNKLGKLKQI